MKLLILLFFCVTSIAGYGFEYGIGLGSYSLSSQKHTANCNHVCSKKYDPLCAGPNGGPYKTYHNKCFYYNDNCRTGFHKLQVLTLSACPDEKKLAKCNRFCTEIDMSGHCFGPKGGPYFHYNSFCQVQVAKCLNNNQWFWASPQKCYCNVGGCSTKYKPVCGGLTGGPYKNYTNLCHFKIAQCMKLYFLIHLELYKNGTCPKNTCTQVCPEHHKPVCGGIKGQPAMTFRNLCVFQLEKCRNKELTYLKDTHCPMCRDNCTREIDNPVCGGIPRRSHSIYQTYPNKCVYDLVNCRAVNQLRILSDSACPSDMDNCKAVCPKTYKPLCGVLSNSGKFITFNNECEFNKANCNSGYNLLLFSLSKCGNHPTRMDSKSFSGQMEQF